VVDNTLADTKQIEKDKLFSSNMLLNTANEAGVTDTGILRSQYTIIYLLSFFS
jgi:hypothetical protein